MSYQKMPQPASDDAIVGLARDMLGNRVYSHHSVPPDLISVVFVPVMFGALKGYTKDQLGRLVVWASEAQHKTAGRYINGYPMFVECCVWRLADFREALARAKQAEALLTPQAVSKPEESAP